MRYAAVWIALLTAAGAHARDPSGRLADILTPNCAQPAVVQPGATLRSVLRENVPLRIESAEGEVTLEFEAARPWRGNWLVESSVPESTAPGGYTLIAEGSDGRDAEFRAVYVLPPYPETYLVAHVHDLRAGDGERPDSRLFRLTAELNTGSPDLILVTGNLTASGGAGQFRIALDALNDCLAPTFVAPGDADNIEGLLEAYLGDYPAALRFGPDAFVMCPPPAELTPARQARLLAERRAVRDARWSIGAAASYSHDDLRAALTLFVDDPLDYVVRAPNADPSDSSQAWGRTRGMTGSGDSLVRWIRITPRGAMPAQDAER